MLITSLGEYRLIVAWSGCTLLIYGLYDIGRHCVCGCPSICMSVHLGITELCCRAVNLFKLFNIFAFKQHQALTEPAHEIMVLIT